LAEGRPDGRDVEHWMKARKQVEAEQAAPRDPQPEVLPATATRKSTTAPGEKPGPHDPEPLPATNAEGYVAISSVEDDAATSLGDDPRPPASTGSTPSRPTRR
jgi:hypothetical protein